MVSKSPSNSWNCAGLAQGMGWRAEKGTTYGIQRKVMCLLITVGSRILESPSFGPALFCVGFIFLFVFFYLWLRWVFVAAGGPSLVAASGGYSGAAVLEFLSAIASLVAEHRLQACGLQ